MRRYWYSLILFAAMLVPTVCSAKEPGVAIQFDPNSPDEKRAAIWLGYLMARAAYRSEHKIPMPRSGTINPTFDEEVSARTSGAQIYVELKQTDKELHDPYWETLSQVKANGFMGAYVWVYLRQSDWASRQQPKNLAAFKTWSQSHLKAHKPVTYGALAVQNE